MTVLDVSRARLRNQRLIGAPFASVEDAVAWFGVVQAQDFAGARWAVGQRTGDTTDREVLRAYHDGTIVRTHVLRPTWHFVVAADLVARTALAPTEIRLGIVTGICGAPFFLLSLIHI